MRHPKDMTYTELVKLVERLQSLTYCDEIERGDPRCPDAIRVGEDAPEAGEWVEVWRPTRWLRGEGSEDFLKLAREAMEGAGLAPEAIAEVKAEEFYNEMEKPRLPVDNMSAVANRQSVPWQDVSTHMLDEGSGKVLFGAETAAAVLALEAVFPKGRWIETDEQQRLLDPGLPEMDLVRRAPPTWVVWGVGAPESKGLAASPRTEEAAAIAFERGFDVAADVLRWAVSIEGPDLTTRREWRLDPSVRGWHQVPERELGMASLAPTPSQGLER